MKLYKQIRYGSILFVGSSLFISLSIFIAIIAKLNIEHVRQEHLITNEKITNEINFYFEDIFGKLRFISRVRGISDNFTNYSDLFLGLTRHNNAIENVFVIDQKNRINFNSSSEKNINPIVYKLSEYVLTNKEETISDVIYDDSIDKNITEENNRFIFYALPIRNSEEYISSSLIVKINLKYLNYILDQIEINTKDSFYIFDKNGFIVAQNYNSVDTKQKMSNEAVVNSIAKNTPLRFSKYTGLSEQTVFGTTNKIKSLSWILLSETPANVILNPLIASLLIFSLILIVFIILVTIVSYKFSKKLLEPLQKLTYAAEHYEDEKIDLEIKTDNELSVLAKAFKVMQKKINDSLSRAKKAEIELKIANDELEERVLQRTEDLYNANRSLSEEIISRERAEIEKEKMYNQLIHSSKLASIGSFAAGIAHEINNPMTIITGFTQILRSIIQKQLNDKDVIKIIDKMEIAQARIVSIVHGMRVYARIDTDEIKDFDAEMEINNTLEIIDPLYKKESITIKFLNNAKHTFVRGNNGRFNQVILNLISNARDAVFKNANERAITIKISNVQNFLKIEVSDNGVGIPKANLSKIFDPFYTTKEPGKGTGLGLSICQSIIQSMDGSISIESELNKGTTFTIIIPNVDHDIESTQEEEKKDDMMINGKAIVIEDEPDIKDFIVAHLLSFGLTVDSAENGYEALNLIKKEKYDFVVTDLMMPVMNGIELIHELKDNNIPHGEIIVVTGGVLADFSNFDKDFIEHSASSIIQKPFTRDTLFKAFA